MTTAVRYLFAVVATALAAVLTAALPELLAPMRLLFLWCAVLITAIVAGVGPGLFAVLLSLLGALSLVFDPRGALLLTNGLDVIRVSMFALFATAITFGVGFRRRAQEEAVELAVQLRARELRYRTLVEASSVPQAVWTATPEGKVRWPDEWTVITGQTREELESGGAIRALHPDDAPRTSNRWREALAAGSYFSDEVRLRVANGRYRWFATRAVPVVGANGIEEWIGTIVDIHDRKRQEEHAAFINRASEALASSLDYEQTMRNLARVCVPAVGDWCGIDIGTGAGYERLVVEHADPSKVQLLRELDALRPPPELDPIVQVLESGRPLLVEDIPDELLASLAGSDQRLALARSLGLRSWIIAPMTARGRTLGALTVVAAESGRRFAEEDVPLVQELARRAAMAMDNARLFEAAGAANRAKDEFLATLSHELRTPLTAITGWAHMLQLGMTDEATTRLAVDTILRSAKAQGELIDDLLDLSRVVAGTLHLQVSVVDLLKIAGDVAIAARPAADARKLAITLSASPSQPALVRADEGRIRQVIWNLVSNAVKFTDQGSVHIEVQTTDTRARVQVTDTGRGIDAAFLPYVWDRFRQADSSTSRSHCGLGLGLSVVRHLVELHGGTVHAESAGPGQGATFAFELPLAPPGAEHR
jgi:PAS domain S-box-containing protein